jgi:hypothetical protein
VEILRESVERVGPGEERLHGALGHGLGRAEVLHRDRSLPRDRPRDLGLAVVRVRVEIADESRDLESAETARDVGLPIVPSRRAIDRQVDPGAILDVQDSPRGLTDRVTDVVIRRLPLVAPVLHHAKVDVARRGRQLGIAARQGRLDFQLPLLGSGNVQSRGSPIPYHERTGPTSETRRRVEGCRARPCPAVDLGEKGLQESARNGTARAPLRDSRNLPPPRSRSCGRPPYAVRPEADPTRASRGRQVASCAELARGRDHRAASRRAACTRREAERRPSSEVPPPAHFKEDGKR